MVNVDPTDWNKHLKNLETWVKPLAEYAKIHGLNVRQLYSKRSASKKPNKKRLGPPPTLICLRVMNDIVNLSFFSTQITISVRLTCIKL